VIEHVTVQKDAVWLLRSGRRFRTAAAERQSAFAEEIRRVGRQYWIQTPDRRFPIESHTWLPVVGWIPRRALLPLLRVTNVVWIKKTAPDWSLLGRSEMSRLFPDAAILEERVLGVPKSIIAVRQSPAPPESGE
jgi:hypothetical protein